MVSITICISGQKCITKRFYVIALLILLFIVIPCNVFADGIESTVLQQSKPMNMERDRLSLLARRSGAENKEKTAPMRFTDKGDGTIRDNVTGLIWLKNANCFGEKTWSEALAECGKLADGNCRLTDGSSGGDWRLPTVKDLLSLIDFRMYDPALPDGHPFTQVQSSSYWSATAYANDDNYAWHVYTYFGGATTNIKSGYYHVWPVRGNSRCGTGGD